jgi:hypothetical protein
MSITTGFERCSISPIYQFPFLLQLVLPRKNICIKDEPNIVIEAS